MSRVFRVEVPLDKDLCPSAPTFGLAVKQVSLTSALKRRAVLNEISVLRRLNGTGDFIGFLGSKVFTNEAYILMEVAEGSLLDLLKRPAVANPSALQPGELVVALQQCRTVGGSRVPEGARGIVLQNDGESVAVDFAGRGRQRVLQDRAHCLGSVGGLDIRASLLIQLLRGLARLEADGLQHHDVKPGNCLIKGKCRSALDCRLVLADFESTCGRGVPGVKQCSLEGTLRYASPEYAQAGIDKGARGWFPKGDVWAAGIVAFELLVGRFPMHVYTGQRESMEYLAWRARPLDDLREGEASEWRSLLEGMLRPNEMQRISAQRAYELAVEIASGLGIPEPPANEFPTLPRGLFAVSP
eukprot:CAMPEP_0176016574 /NCGR_PEP_ID=MMETSP0120_2-20121206/7921_1 /TAXON_ID=160619 /ORGANISM="Kryptoperidinium foliaceum, Strain CCMP 1326" /LENGTH=355 /DNA_ID=CAMNT_0017349575 /DNA_START=110 /DNA_END=1174 /DNA_ORIENTATION=+